MTHQRMRFGIQELNEIESDNDYHEPMRKIVTIICTLMGLGVLYLAAINYREYGIACTVFWLFLNWIVLLVIIGLVQLDGRDVEEY